MNNFKIIIAMINDIFCVLTLAAGVYAYQQDKTNNEWLFYLMLSIIAHINAAQYDRDLK